MLTLEKRNGKKGNIEIHMQKGKKQNSLGQWFGRFGNGKTRVATRHSSSATILSGCFLLLRKIK